MLLGRLVGWRTLLLLALAGLGGAVPAACPAAPAQVLPYIDHIAIYTLGYLVNHSTQIAVFTVDKVSREKKVILLKKASDLKGRSSPDDRKVQVTDGFRSHEPHLFLNWAFPGRTV